MRAWSTYFSLKRKVGNTCGALKKLLSQIPAGHLLPLCLWVNTLKHYPTWRAELLIKTGRGLSVTPGLEADPGRAHRPATAAL